MSRHVTYRGVSVDMESLRRENEHTPAMGNMKVNAKGDQISKGIVTKTVDQVARENHRVQSTIVNTGLKGKQPETTNISLEIETPKSPKPVKTPVAATKPAKEKELPSGDIVIEDDSDAT